MRKILLCAPDHYGIEYEINPWMDRTQKASPELARSQWQGLHQKLRELGQQVELLPPQRGLPDMVFTANAGLVAGNKFVRSNFRFKERQGEEEHFEKWFAERKYEVVRLPEGMFFEGEGDALFCGEVLLCGYRFRSDIRSHQRLGEILQCLVISVELVQDRFYHLDTCFCPLPRGGALWYPQAFDEYGQRAIRHHVKELVDVSSEEAMRFACNAVTLGNDIIMPEGCPQLQQALNKLGYNCHGLCMTEFMKAGGACKCLTLLLPQKG
jgi:N-dimethylarginine dimethylaminohydrolase